MARIRDPSGIQDLRAYFCRVLIRVIYALRGQLGAILPDDLTALADTGQGQARDWAPPRPVDELAAESLDARGWRQFELASAAHRRCGQLFTHGQQRRRFD